MRKTVFISCRIPDTGWRYNPEISDSLVFRMFRSLRGHCNLLTWLYKIRCVKCNQTVQRRKGLILILLTRGDCKNCECHQNKFSKTHSISYKLVSQKCKYRHFNWKNRYLCTNTLPKRHAWLINLIIYETDII